MLYYMIILAERSGFAQVFHTKAYRYVYIGIQEKQTAKQALAHLYQILHGGLDESQNDAWAKGWSRRDEG